MTIYNPASSNRNEYLKNVQDALSQTPADMIAVSAGFDNHEDDWGGLLKTEDYKYMGKLVRETARRNNGGCFGILEGGYNHSVLGKNVLAFVEGLGENNEFRKIILKLSNGIGRLLNRDMPGHRLNWRR